MVTSAERSEVLDFLVKMFLEERTFARHHEGQRSAVTSIFTSLAVLLLGAIGTVWQTQGSLDERSLPFSIGLFLIGSLGFGIILKLFERSMLHLSLSEAYREIAETILRQDVASLIGDRVSELTYVRHADEAVQKHGEQLGLSSVDFLAGHKRVTKLNLGAFKKRISNHVPIDPREIVVPLHDSATRGISWGSLRVLWGGIYLAFAAAGLGFSIVAIAASFD